jgi:hypothetical protein
MSKGRHSFRRGDVTRAIKAVMAAGAEVDRAEIDPNTGKIVVFVAKSGASPAKTPNEWDTAE